MMWVFVFLVGILTGINAGIADRCFKKGDVTQGLFAAALVVLGLIFLCREML